ncbi:protein of unknown function [Paraburkholderia kururiensis]
MAGLRRWASVCRGTALLALRRRRLRPRPQARHCPESALTQLCAIAWRRRLRDGRNCVTYVTALGTQLR